MHAAQDDVVRATGSIRVVLGVVGALLVVVLVLTGVLSLVGGSSTPPRPRLDGQRVTAFVILPGVNRGAVHAPWLSGHPTVLLLFANWCAPCHAELPALAQAVGDGRFGPVMVVGIDADRSPSVALSFVTSSGVRFPVAQDADQTVISALVPALPATVFVTSLGTIAGIHYGAITPAQLRVGVASIST